VHRLDRPTTGCCIVARSPFGQQALSNAFRRHLVDKRYLAVVVGVPTWKKLGIDARLLRKDDPNARRGPMAWTVVDDSGKRALTRVRVLARAEDESIALVEARPETGRMHQIRVHLAHVGHPLLGDPVYGERDERVPLLLHAWAISFPAPSGGRRFVTAPAPDVMRRACADHGIDVEACLAPERERFEEAAKKTGFSRRDEKAKKSGAPKPKSKSKAKATPGSKAGRKKATSTRQKKAGGAGPATKKTSKKKGASPRRRKKR
jgi:hypothetical protein